jgi:drug/metabolite transporter (DMT)-like permease
MLSKPKAIVLLVCSAILWSTAGVLIKWIQWHPLAICGARSFIAAGVLWLYLRKPHFTWSFAQVGGALAYAATVLLYVSAVKMTTAANAILLQYTAPAWVAVFSAGFLGERVTRVDWASVALTMAGMVLFFREGLASVSLVGDLLALLSGFTIAWMTLFMRKQKEGSSLESALLGNLIAGVVGIPFMFGAAPSAQGWLGLGLLGVFQLGLSYILYTRALKSVTAVEAIIVSTLEPILNPIWAMLLLAEYPAMWALAGGSLVVLAVTGRGALYALRPRPARHAAGAE